MSGVIHSQGERGLTTQARIKAFVTERRDYAVTARDASEKKKTIEQRQERILCNQRSDKFTVVAAAKDVPKGAQYI
jgi:hypothetical protein